MTENRSLTTTSEPMSLTDTMTLGTVLAKSGFFQDARDAAQAVVKVLAGREMGFGPVASMTGINIIQGRVAISANLMAAAVQRSGRYDFRVRELTDTAAEIEFFDGQKSIGVSRFTIEDARKAGTKNLDKFPRNMLFARAMSNGVRWYCPQVTSGPVYTPEELGATVDGETGEVISAAPSGGNGHGPNWSPELAPEDTDHGTPVVTHDSPPPTKEPKSSTPATRQRALNVAPDVADMWRAGIRGLVEKYAPFYGEGNAVNWFRIWGHLGKTYQKIDAGNLQAVLSELEQHAVDNAAVEVEKPPF